MEALAAATPAEVIVEWQGLGYNRRAVSLHRAAQAVAERRLARTTSPSFPASGRTRRRPSRNFAFGRDVLPVDTNVRRVQERTGEAFDGACAQALFDLGATICLGRIPRCGDCPLAEACPSRGKRYEPPGASRGSRARSASVAPSRSRAVAGGSDSADEEALASLARDGLVTLAGDGNAALPV